MGRHSQSLAAVIVMGLLLPAVIVEVPRGGFGALKTDSRALNTTDYAFTVDLLPDFMPRAIVFPGYSNDPRNLCFNWPFGAPGPWGDSSRAAVLDTPPQTFRIDLGTPRYSASTRGIYHLRRFYEGAQQEGAKECS